MQLALMRMTGSEEKEDLSYDQLHFCADVETLVRLSDCLGDNWRLGRQADTVWLELSSCLNVVSEGTVKPVSCQYQVHYSLSYMVPILLVRFSWSSGELVDHDTVRREVLGENVSYDMVSMAAHPLTGLPWFQVHPCKTEAVTRAMRLTEEKKEKCNFLVTFLSLYGQAVGLNINPKYASSEFG